MGSRSGGRPKMPTRAFSWTPRSTASLASLTPISDAHLFSDGAHPGYRPSVWLDSRRTVALLAGGLLSVCWLPVRAAGEGAAVSPNPAGFLRSLRALTPVDLESLERGR